MSKPRYQNKRDGNHSVIQTFLEDHGCEVLDVSKVGRVPDLLVRHRSAIFWLECKMPGSAAKYTREQLKYVSETRFDVAIATGTDDAWGKIIAREFLSGNQKRRLAAMLLRSEKDCYTPREVNEALYP